jgi:hypothetical protein
LVVAGQRLVCQELFNRELTHRYSRHFNGCLAQRGKSVIAIDGQRQPVICEVRAMTNEQLDRVWEVINRAIDDRFGKTLVVGISIEEKRDFAERVVREIGAIGIDHQAPRIVPETEQDLQGM